MQEHCLPPRGSHACPLCHSNGPFEVIDELMCTACTCGHVFQEDASSILTPEAGFNAHAEWIQSGRRRTEGHYLYGTSANEAIIKLRSRGAAGSSIEAQKADRELYNRAHAADLQSHLRRVLRRLTRTGPSRHPYEARIRGIFDTFRAEWVRRRAVGEAADLVLPSRLTWGKVANAALAACIYVVFLQEDALLDVERANCFSLHLVASCSDVRVKEARAWFHALCRTFPSRFGGYNADDPILHVDFIARRLQDLAGQVTPDETLTPTLHRPLHALSEPQWQRICLLSRALCASLLSPASQLRELMERAPERTSPGEWAFYIVLWALSTEVGEKLLGKDWIKRDLITATLGLKVRSRDGQRQVDDDGGGSAGEDQWRRIRLYHEVGAAIARRAVLLPWVPPDAIRKVKGGRIALKEGLEVRYIQQVVDFADELDELESIKGFRAGPSTSAGRDAAAHDAAVMASRATVAPPPPVVPPASYTARNFPALSDDPSLLDTMDAATIDALLFGPDEMDSYLRSDPAERDALHQRKLASGEWTPGEDETGGDPASTGDRGRPARKRKAPSRSGISTSLTAPSEDTCASPSQAAQRVTRSRRTKADARLLAAARGDVISWGSDEAGSPVGAPSSDDNDSRVEAEVTPVPAPTAPTAPTQSRDLVAGPTGNSSEDEDMSEEDYVAAAARSDRDGRRDVGWLFEEGPSSDSDDDEL
ncbi:unnamed protein product [Parajaminaea phylloscopi]